MASERVIVIGAVAAGTSAAAKAKRTNPDLDICVYGREAHVSYSACGLPYLISGAVADYQALIARTPAQFARDGVTVKTEHEVIDLDVAAGRVTVRDLATNSTFHDHFDRLVLATGARVNCPPVRGIELQGVFRLRSMHDGLAIQTYISEQQPKHAVVVGAGYIGLEMAEALLDRGIGVTLVNRSKTVLSSLDHDMSSQIISRLEAAGVQLALGCGLEGLEGKHDRVTHVVAGGRDIPAELVIIATGVQPNSELAQSCGAELGEHGAIKIDQLGRTSVDRVYAAGDCSTVDHRILNKPVYLPLGTTANKQGRTLGAYLAGHERPFRGVVGTAVTKFADLHIAATGLSVEQALHHGYHVRSKIIHSTDHAGYYPNARPITVKLVADAADGTLLGGQIIGFDDVAKRVDVVAVALAGRMTVDEFAWQDLSYAPPFSSVWDPLLVAAQALAKG
ncbi:MAG TPA: CoA-disulfide reductase [Herpetosiphon sp.]|uniref:FAD-dependent pyridine nucleotide-disulphide oxidoreductase n=1 Tax=Herpetosiphon aurantiacus (strain ATCC 23779 / DSM 785 / 114-95) TaxID=316274 RepID=A9AWT6_HERA2|nr:CoA-disulfide reductase [Herpetosiphon sp.]ABX03337.1 FAD-dependent pyridine nucleotide-disulphide oxidoreductase [Herpetosiphon aurantiacus DSM 785]HBW50492.1 CoA-disulfide reductase [Herpetosiphon sp.]